ncbi:MAG: hypothetical protein WD060_13975 [Pirellulales bacterium]
MVEPVVMAEDAKLLAEARDTVEIVDAEGNRLGLVARRLSHREIETALIRAAAGGSARGTADVLKRMKHMKEGQDHELA